MREHGAECARRHRRGVAALEALDERLVAHLSDPLSGGDDLLRRTKMRHMPLRLHHIVFDAHDLPGLARFWAEVLRWRVLSEREREVVIGPDEAAPVGICFMPVTDEKRVKNRLHLDLTSEVEDRADEIERVLALGARRVDIGQTGEESWVVLADPEGNEFCVVRPKMTLIS
jgi:predicted enzyme related to lactoylglutathione lyase